MDGFSFIFRFFDKLREFFGWLTSEIFNSHSDDDSTSYKGPLEKQKARKHGEQRERNGHSDRESEHSYGRRENAAC